MRLLSSFALVALVSSLASLAHAGVYVEEEQTVGGMPGMQSQTMLVKSWYDGDRVKQVLPGTDMWVLLNLKSHEVTFIMTAQKQYWVVPADLYGRMTQASLQAFGVTSNPDGTVTAPKGIFKPTGKKCKSGKWSGNEVVANVNVPQGGAVKMTMCFSEAVGLSFVDTLRGAMGQGSKELEAFFAEAGKLKGYPVLTTTEVEMQGQKMTVTKTVKVVEKRKLADAEFAIPAGYTKSENPPGLGMGGGAGPGGDLMVPDAPLAPAAPMAPAAP